MIPCVIIRTKIDFVKNRKNVKTKTVKNILTFSSKSLRVCAIQDEDNLTIPEKITKGFLVKHEEIGSPKSKNYYPEGIDFVYFDKAGYKISFHNIDRKDSIIKRFIKILLFDTNIQVPENQTTN